MMEDPFERHVVGEPCGAAAILVQIGRDEKSPNSERYFKKCHFYRVELDLQAGIVEEPELEAGWLARRDALEMLAAPAFRWAVERALAAE